MIDITHVLCPVDFSEFSFRALEHAAAVATWYDAKLTTLYVWKDVPTYDVVFSPDEIALPATPLSAESRESLEAKLVQFSRRAAGDVPCTPVVRRAADIDEDVLALADELRASLIVVGSHGRSGVERVLLGSVAENLVRKAPYPVMVVPAHVETPVGPLRFKRVVCPVDFSDGSLAAFEYALSLVEESDGRLYLLTVLEIPPELRELPAREGIDVASVRAAAAASALSRLRSLVPAEARTYCAVQTEVREGKAHREILAMAQDTQTDVIVMGVSGHGALDRWVFGSNTASVIRRSRCPVLTVPVPA